MKATIEMIAQSAGVSRGTVDRVLHNRPSVKPEVRERVLQTIREMNYKPNEAARALAFNKNARKVGIFVPPWGDFFKHEISRGITAACSELNDYGIQVLIENYKTENPTAMIKKITEMVKSGISGLCLCAKNSTAIKNKINELTAEKIPVITYNSDLEDSSRLCFIGQDVVRSGRIAAELMSKCIDKKSHVLIICGNMEFTGHKQRVDGFIQVMKKHHFPPENLLIKESFNEYKLTYKEVTAALQKVKNLTAIYMANENIDACIAAVKDADLNHHICIITHDVTDSTKEFLQRNMVDFALEQDICYQGYRPLIILKNIIIEQKYPVSSLEHTHINIITAENI